MDVAILAKKLMEVECSLRFHSILARLTDDFAYQTLCETRGGGYSRLEVDKDFIYGYDTFDPSIRDNLGTVEFLVEQVLGISEVAELTAEEKNFLELQAFGLRPEKIVQA